MVHALWTVMPTLVLVPVAVASLRGWTPRWSPAVITRVTEARGMAVFMIYGASLTPAARHASYYAVGVSRERTGAVSAHRPFSLAGALWPGMWVSWSEIFGRPVEQSGSDDCGL